MSTIDFTCRTPEELEAAHLARAHEQALLDEAARYNAEIEKQTLLETAKLKNKWAVPASNPAQWAAQRAVAASVSAETWNSMHPDAQPPRSPAGGAPGKLGDVQPTRMTRAKCLDAARACVLGSRAEAYGEPEESFALIAEFWSAYLGQKIAKHDAAAMMILFKIARFHGSPALSDHMVDSAGYSAIAAELASTK